MADTDIIQLKSDILSRSKINLSAKKTFLQIEKTISFEFIRNSGKLLAMVITSLALFALNLAIQLISEDGGAERAELAVNYFTSYLGMLNLLILIIGTTFGGNIIAMDFEKQTGNLVFPKIPKGRLLAGRIVARYIMAVVSLFMYYLPTAILTYIYYDQIPDHVWESYGWAAFYLFLVLSFVIFFSSFMKRSSGATIWSLLILLIVFNMIQNILMFTGVEAEPLYILTYYANIITASFNMPADDARYVLMNLGGMGPEGGLGREFYMWSTPSRLGAGIGMGIYSIILLSFAYIFFLRRQNKQ